MIVRVIMVMMIIMVMVIVADKTESMNVQGVTGGLTLLYWSLSSSCQRKMRKSTLDTLCLVDTIT